MFLLHHVGACGFLSVTAVGDAGQGPVSLRCSVLGPWQPLCVHSLPIFLSATRSQEARGLRTVLILRVTGFFSKSGPSLQAEGVAGKLPVSLPSQP